MLAVSRARAADLERLADRGLEPPAERERRLRVDLLADDDELVAAEARDGVGGPHGLRSRRPSSASTASPAAWPKRSLTLLEVVEVDEQHAGRDALARRSARARARAGRAAACGWRARSAGRAAASWRIRSSPRSRASAVAEDVGDRAHEARLLLGELARENAGDQLASVADPQPHVDAGRPPPKARTVAGAHLARARPAASAAAARPPRPRARARSAPASARSPIAATARSRRSAARRAETSRPIASSSLPAAVWTMPQLISPTNSVPSSRTPHASVENRSGCSVAK